MTDQEQIILRIKKNNREIELLKSKYNINEDITCELIIIHLNKENTQLEKLLKEKRKCLKRKR